MPKPQQWPRDEKGKPARMLRARETNDVFRFLEALAAMEVVITPNGRAKGQFLATPKHCLLSIDLVSPLYSATASVTVAPLGQYLVSIPATGLPDKTPVAVDMGSTHDSQIIYGGSYVSSGTISVKFYNTDPSVVRTLNGLVSARVV